MSNCNSTCSKAQSHTDPFAQQDRTNPLYAPDLPKQTGLSLLAQATHLTSSLVCLIITMITKSWAGRLFIGLIPHVIDFSLHMTDFMKLEALSVLYIILLHWKDGTTTHLQYRFFSLMAFYLITLWKQKNTRMGSLSGTTTKQTPPSTI